MFALALASAVVLSQSDVYTWVDEQGVVHYTDGASGLPANAEKTEPDGAVTVLSREPQNLIRPAPEPRPSPVPRPSAEPRAPAPSTASADRPAPPVSGARGMRHTTSYPGLEGLDVYYARPPQPYGYGYGYGYGYRRMGPGPQLQPPRQKANPAPELIVNTPAPAAPRPKKQGGKASVLPR